VLYAYARGAAPAAAAAEAVRPGSACDYAQRGNAPVIDVAYLSDPLIASAAADATPAEVGRDVMLIVTERVGALTASVATG
jgi:hypothetical protein